MKRTGESRGSFLRESYFKMNMLAKRSLQTLSLLSLVLVKAGRILLQRGRMLMRHAPKELNVLAEESENSKAVQAVRNSSFMLYS